MGRKKEYVLLGIGILAGMMLSPAVANATENWFKATPSTQIFIVDGQNVELEAYAINGHNYVKLRDVGKAVDFNVYYDGNHNAAVMEPDKPYTGEDVAAVTPTPSIQPSEKTDYAALANPAVFAGELSRENYNAIRDTVLHRYEIADGSYQPIPMGEFSRNGVIDVVTAAIGGYPVYETVSQPGGGYVCIAKYPESYQDAIEHTKGFLDGLAGMSDSEKVTAMAWYVADRITYSVKYSTPSEVLAQDGQLPGACMSYAYSFRFLCDLAGIPCILTQNQDHQWNQVYVDGLWRDVDVTGIDVEDVEIDRSLIHVLPPLTDIPGSWKTDKNPAAAAFAKELLVPGSTK